MSKPIATFSFPQNGSTLSSADQAHSLGDQHIENLHDHGGDHHEHDHGHSHDHGGPGHTHEHLENAGKLFMIGELVDVG
jgi:hypothetical protein